MESRALTIASFIVDESNMILKIWVKTVVFVLLLPVSPSPGGSGGSGVVGGGSQGGGGPGALPGWAKALETEIVEIPTSNINIAAE